MRNINWASKLTSRKFWAAIASFATMLIVALGGTESSANQTAALIMAGASVVAYIIGEGLADAAGAKTTETYLVQDDAHPPESDPLEDDLK